MLISIVTPDAVILQNHQVDGVFVETDMGPIAILDHHASLVTASRLGSLRVVAGGKTDQYLLRNAILQMDNRSNTLNVSALACETTGQVTQLDLSNYLAQVTAALASGDVEKGSLQYHFLEGERIALERKVNKK